MRIAKLKEVASATLLEMAQVVSLLIIFPITTRALGPSAYGEYTTVYIIAGFAITWVWASCSPAMVQLILQRHNTIDSTLSCALRQIAIVALPAALIGFVISGLILGQDILLATALILVSELLVMGLAEAHIAVAYAVHGATASSRVRVIAPAVKTAGVLALSVAGSVTIVSLVLVNTAAALILLAVSIATYRHLRHDLRLEQPTPATARGLRNLTVIYAVSMSAGSFQNDGDKMALATFRPSSEVGEYVAAYRLVSVIMLPLRAVEIAAARWFFPTKSDEGNHLRRSVRLFVPMGIYATACGIGVWVVQPLTARFVGPEFEQAVEITTWLCLFPLLRVAGSAPALGLIGLGRNRERMVLGIVGATTAVISYLLLVPDHGWRGAVIGTYLSEIVTAAGGWLLLVHYQRKVAPEPASIGAAESHTGS